MTQWHIACDLPIAGSIPRNRTVEQKKRPTSRFTAVYASGKAQSFGSISCTTRVAASTTRSGWRDSLGQVKQREDAIALDPFGRRAQETDASRVVSNGLRAAAQRSCASQAYCHHCHRLSSRHPQVRQREQGHPAGSVLGQSTEANLRQPKLALQDLERVRFCRNSGVSPNGAGDRPTVKRPASRTGMRRSKLRLGGSRAVPS